MTNYMKSSQPTFNYLSYLKDHPEVLQNQPSCTNEGVVWLKKMFACECPAHEAVNEMRAIVQRWERYHLLKAESLGFEIDIEEFKEWQGGPFKENQSM